MDSFTAAIYKFRNLNPKTGLPYSREEEMRKERAEKVDSMKTPDETADVAKQAIMNERKRRLKQRQEENNSY